MARPAMKRKAEAISNNKAHAVPRHSIATKEERSSPDHDSAEEFSEDERRVRGKTSGNGHGKDVMQVKRARKMDVPLPVMRDEYQEDRGRMESLQFMKSVKAVASGRRGGARRATQVLREVQESVQVRETAALTAIDAQYAEITASATQFLTDFCSIHTAILTDPISPTPSTQKSGRDLVTGSNGGASAASDYAACTSHTSHALFPKCTAALRNLQTVLDNYEGLNTKISDIERDAKQESSTDCTLTRDLETLARLLDSGKEVARRKARYLLHGEGADENRKGVASNTKHGAVAVAVAVRKDGVGKDGNAVAVEHEGSDGRELVIDVDSLFFGKAGIARNAATTAAAGLDDDQRRAGTDRKVSRAGDDGDRHDDAVTYSTDDDLESWATVATKQERAVKRLVDTLPAYKPTTKAEEWSD